jgi:transposase InsO family protein
MKSKSNVFSCFKIFRAMFEKDSCHIIKALSLYNGGEYISTKFSSYLALSGITHEPGPPHSPELNGTAERKNRTIGNLIQCFLISAHLPKSFWADAMCHIAFLFNSVPCRTPSGFKSLNDVRGIKPTDPTTLHPFGCLVWYKIPNAT